MIPTGFEPMLASPLKKGTQPKFPCLASPKFDGVRGVVFNGTAFSRKLKKIPNLYLQSVFGSPLLHGVDGEFIVGDPTDDAAYRKTMSGVMSEVGVPAGITFFVFDLYFHDKRGLAFIERYEALEKKVKSLPAPLKNVVRLVEHVMINNAEELAAYEQKCLDLGYEGAMTRSLTGPYKCGRSTPKEEFLLKVKRFMDGEAEILECLELQHNMNEATKNELGRTKRSSHKAGRVPGGKLGALAVRDVKTGVEFQIGSGFHDTEKESLWKIRDSLIGKIVKYQYFPMGSKERPRFPVFLGFRDPIDM